MTAGCPNGHQSATTDYCDRCGAPIGSAQAEHHSAPPGPERSPLAASTEILPPVDEIDTSAAEPAQPCPECGAPRSGNDRYCEQCGHDFVAPPVAVLTAWEAVAAADRAQFDRLAPEGLEFPVQYGERRFPLNGAALRIGRSRGRPGDPVLEIDLAGQPHDPGISRLHAELVRQDDGSYAVRDLGSTNGTTVNDDPRPVSGEAPVRLSAGDRIRLGAWTTLTLRAR